MAAVTMLQAQMESILMFLQCYQANNTASFCFISQHRHINQYLLENYFLLLFHERRDFSKMFPEFSGCHLHFEIHSPFTGFPDFLAHSECCTCF